MNQQSQNSFEGSLESCTCPDCQDMCMVPCMGTVADIQKLIDAGFAGRLATRSYFFDGVDIIVVAPAVRGQEKRSGGSGWSKERCTFQQNGLCELHELDLKPTEGRQVIHRHHNDFVSDFHYYALRDRVIADWNTRAGKALFRQWKLQQISQGDEDVE